MDFKVVKDDDGSQKWVSSAPERNDAIAAQGVNGMLRHSILTGLYQQTTEGKLQKNTARFTQTLALVVEGATKRSAKECRVVLQGLYRELEIMVLDRTSELLEVIAELDRENTERRRAEHAIEVERKRLDDVLEMLPAYLILLTPDYRVPFANRFFRERFGVSDGKRCYEYLFGRNEPCEVCESFRALKLMKPVEWEWVGPDNRTYYVYDFPFHDRDGTVLILEMGIDISSRKETENALQAAHHLLEDRVKERTKELAESNAHLRAEIEERRKVELALRQSEERYRLLAEELRQEDRNKDNFLAMLSHELRNPLASTKAALQILNQQSEIKEQGIHAKDVLDRQVNQLTRLVDDLLDMTRISQNKIHLQQEQIEINRLVHCVVEDHQAIFDLNGISLQVELAPTDIYVDADKVRLAQVIGNLLMNATKFTHQGGYTRVVVSFDAVEQHVRLCVKDNGVGIPSDVMPLLFRPFIQAESTRNRSHSGLGLGLALVKGIIELHGGTVTVKSAGLGKGAEFAICLPVSCGKGEAPQPKIAEPVTYRRRVLIIDDNVDLTFCLRELLELKGHEVAVADCGKDGLLLAREFRPEAVFCDIGLPDMDGHEVARAFRSDDELKDVCLIALTGYALQEDPVHHSEGLFDMHLAKPPDFAIIEQAIAQCCNERKAT